MYGLCFFFFHKQAHTFHARHAHHSACGDRLARFAAGRVTEAIDNTVPVGAVYVDGKTWSARSETGENIAVDTLVRVTRMEGVRLFVKEKKD